MRAPGAAGTGNTAAGQEDLGVSLEVLRLILSADDLGAGRPALTLGAKADPYPQAESALGLTRHLLETLAALPAGGEGLSLNLLTRSPLLLRDLDLLAELDQRHAVRVGVVIGAADRALARRIEPQARPWQDAGERVTGASPAERFALVRELADRGIDASVVCTPLVPGFNNGAAALCRLFERAAAAGAADVVPAPRHPALPPTAFESRHLLPLFHRLRLEHGFPRALPGRG
jgi:DNA repair photolyase